MTATIRCLAAERAKRERRMRHEEAIQAALEAVSRRNRKAIQRANLETFRLRTYARIGRWFEDERHG